MAKKADEKKRLLQIEKDAEQRFIEKRLSRYVHLVNQFQGSIAGLREVFGLLNEYANLRAHSEGLEGDYFPISKDKIVEKEDAIRAGVFPWLFDKEQQ